MGEFHKLVKTCYLSGAMDGLSTDTVDEKFSMSIWRDRSEKYFSKNGIDVINPIRFLQRLMLGG